MEFGGAAPVNINWAEEAEGTFNAPAPQVQQGVNEWGGGGTSW